MLSARSPQPRLSLASFPRGSGGSTLAAVSALGSGAWGPAPQLASALPSPRPSRPVALRSRASPAAGSSSARAIQRASPALHAPTPVVAFRRLRRGGPSGRMERKGRDGPRSRAAGVFKGPPRANWAHRARLRESQGEHSRSGGWDAAARVALASPEASPRRRARPRPVPARGAPRRPTRPRRRRRPGPVRQAGGPTPRRLLGSPAMPGFKGFYAKGLTCGEGQHCMWIISVSVIRPRYPTDDLVPLTCGRESGGEVCVAFVLLLHLVVSPLPL